jgi:hypothetical protein
MAYYPFLALHPTEDGVAVSITNISTVNCFDGAWSVAPNKAHAEFGWDSPLHTNKSGGYGIRSLKSIHCCQVISMQMSEYIELVMQHAGKR